MDYLNNLLPNRANKIINLNNVKTGHLNNAEIGHSQSRTGQCPVPTIRSSKFGQVTPRSLSTIIGSYKGIVTKYAKQNNIDFVWQPRFHDHIIRNENELFRIRKYIDDNTNKWHRDRNNNM